jgi:DNA-binding NtrC family response regulator
MMITSRSLYAFVDSQDPFVASGVAGEDQTGPILSLMAARPFNSLFLFFTPQTQANAEETFRAVKQKHHTCTVIKREVPVSDPRDFSSLTEGLAYELRDVTQMTRNSENYVCVSSGTVEMRAALFMLVAAGVLPATLLQVGSPADPLFGTPSVKEVRLDTPDWHNLRHLVVSGDYSKALAFSHFITSVEAEPAAAPADQFSELEDALKELQISIGSAGTRFAAEKIAMVASTDVPILLLGETGTGKELFAKLVHRLSDRRNKEFVPVNCAAIPKELMESYLFGHVKGAFTGATDNREGKFEQADNSTLFLDEIGELTPDAQAKLLRVLQDGKIEPLGSRQVRTVDVRIVAATNRDLQREMADRRFREDLYFRLRGVEVSLPPLRERREEIPQMAVAILERLNQKFRRQKSLAKDSLLRLVQYSWPGNVRELENVLRESVLLAKQDVIKPEDLEMTMKAYGRSYLDLLPAPGPGFDLKEFQRTVKAHYIRKALSICNGNQTRAAELLGMTKQAVSDFLTNENDRPA